MKKTLLSFSLSFFALGVSAQTINIPDPYFKERLLLSSPTSEIAKNINGTKIKIDTNNNGEIEASEALAVYQLKIDNNIIHDLTGIEYFTNLWKLDCWNNSLDSFSTAGLTNLKYLDISSSNITSIDVSALVNLEKLIMAYPDCNTLDLSALTNLKEVYAYMGVLQSINVSGLMNLEKLEVQDNMISNLDLSGLTNLEYLTCGSNAMFSIDLTGLTSLDEMHADGNLFNTIDLSDCTSLREMTLQGNYLSSIDLTGLIELEAINIASNQLTSLIVNGTSNLEILHCENNHFSDLDLSNFTSLSYIDLDSNMLQRLNIKNGVNNGNSISLTGNPYLSYICVDDFEYNQLQTTLPYFNIPNCVFNSYCSFVPGGQYYTLQGNNNYTLSGSDCSTGTLWPSMRFNITNGANTGAYISNNTGEYAIPFTAGTHTVTPVIENPAYFTISPASVTMTFPSMGSPQIQNFCLFASEPASDLEVLVVPTVPARPGFTASYKILFKNKGNQIQSGNLNFEYDDERLDYISSSPAFSTQSTDSFSWDYDNLMPFETREIAISFTVNAPSATPPVNNGDQLEFTAIISPVAGDATPSDNDFGFKQTVVGSFDPNEKTCLEGQMAPATIIGDYVHYFIRFENTGTYPAENIVVKDMIDITKFDMPTLVPIGGSHQFTTRIAGNKVEFIFENINLPFVDSSNDGYVAFKIKTLPSLTSGAVLTNNASIYFDYNFPIVTNTATTTIDVLGIRDFEFSDYVKIYPNPTSGIVNLDTIDTTIKSASVYNILGQLLFTIANETQVRSIDVSSLESGNYFIRVATDRGSATTKFIKN